MNIYDIRTKVMSEEPTAKTLFSKTVEAAYRAIRYGSLEFIDIQMKLLTDKNNMGSDDLYYGEVNITSCYFNRDCYKILNYSRELIKTMFFHSNYRKRLTDSEMKDLHKKINDYKNHCGMNYSRVISLADGDDLTGEESWIDFDHSCHLVNYVIANMLYFYCLSIQREDRLGNYEFYQLTEYFEEIQTSLKRELVLFDIRVGELK